MKNMKRSIRRHHFARIKKKWYNTVKNDWFWEPENINEEWMQLISSFLTTTHTTCSTCLGHLNPRVYEGGTLQEKRNLLSFNEELEDL